MGQGQLLHLQTPLPAGGTGFLVTFSLSGCSSCLGACVGSPSSHILRAWGQDLSRHQTVTPPNEGHPVSLLGLASLGGKSL